MSWLKIKKIVILKCLLLLYATTTNHFSDCDVWRKVDFMRQLVTISSVVELRNAPKHFPKPNLHQKKVMAAVWWPAACLIHYSFLNPGETITSKKYAQQIDKIHQNLQCLQLALVNRKGPILLHDNFKFHLKFMVQNCDYVCTNLKTSAHSLLT